MGHIHLGVLPSSVKWREVVGLLVELAPSDDVIAAAAIAAETDLRNAADDHVFVEAVRLLAIVPQAAADADFGAALRDQGVVTSRDPDLLELVTALGARLDRVADAGRRTDFGELSRRALLSTVTLEIGGALPGLFDATPDDLRAVARRLGHPRAFAGFARAFFTTLLSQTLSSWLDRTLSAHVGPGQRFAHVGERRAFDDALAQYCVEATRIIREFSAGWYGKTLQRGGPLGTRDATIFGAVALKKITEELRRKQGVDA